MTSRMVSVVAAAMIAGAIVYEPPAETQPVPEPIDFAQLNYQAAAALQALQAMQAQRIIRQLDDTVPIPVQ